MQIDLFGDTSEPPFQKKKSHFPHKERKQKKQVAGWEFTDHACHNCMGRIVRRENQDGTIVHRCCECGASAVGDHTAMCWCGAEVRGHGMVFECFRNPNITLAAPNEILVRERPLVKIPERQVGRTSNPVRIAGFR